ncbi:MULTISPECIES: helix-turn-helix transcriptional regulator [Spirosoma]|uniref:Helix-turn-helix transcriptional regulator n=1 Tax=Spirosoma liriopis TaxID=2937440 RepID=A0ABT0HK21_9BACT|nr:MULTISPECIES: helix-turn-helix transcriptional regulator [Spirosoma]MCK8492008.1 helix-turn-helix transcriptional regulator [Spirosoma liriopis]UHG91430.1 helix-turn-helix transcriptional regulator [Spirosoma oryzicola]
MLRVPSSIEANQFQSLKIQEMTFVAYRSDVYPERNEVFFEEHAVIVILEGEKKFSSPTQELHVHKGQILFFQRGCYSMNESIDSSYRSLVFFVNEKLLKEFVSQHLALFQSLPVPLPLPADLILSFSSSPTFVTFIDSLLPYFGAKTPFLNELLRLKFQELLLHLLELDASNQLKAILRHIYEGQKTDLDYLMSTYLLKPLSMNELARLSGRSLSAFKRDFEEHFHTSPGQWIRQKRLTHAHFLLRNTVKNVSEVSMEIGYESVSHFIKAYKQQYGFTPKQVH